MNKQINSIETNNKGSVRKTILIVIIVIFGLFIIGVAGFYFFAYSLINTNDTVTTEEVTEENESTDEVTFSDSDLEKYVNYINPVSTGPSSLLYNASTIVVKDLSCADKIQLIGSNIFSKQKESADYQYSIISEEDVKNVVEEVYGPDTYEKTSFNLGTGEYTLNETDYNYYSKTGCGGTSGVIDYNQIIGYDATKDKLEITTAYAFYNAGDKKIYKDYNLTVSLESYNGTDYDSYMKNYINSNKDNLNSIVYTFESTDGINYYFTKLVNKK